MKNKFDLRISMRDSLSEYQEDVSLFDALCNHVEAEMPLLARRNYVYIVSAIYQSVSGMSADILWNRFFEGDMVTPSKGAIALTIKGESPLAPLSGEFKELSQKWDLFEDQLLHDM